MADNDKIPPEVEQALKDDPAQTDPPTPIIMGQEPIPNPDIDSSKKNKKN